MDRTPTPTIMQTLLAKVRNARSNLLSVLIFSVVNIPLILFSGGYFLFSLSVTQLLTFTINEVRVDPEFADILLPMILIFAVPMAIILGLYFVCWLCSKKRAGWLTFAAVLFGLDCLLLGFSLFLNLSAGAFDLFSIIDVAYHVWVMISLIKGAAAAAKLKRMPAEEPITPIVPPSGDYTYTEIPQEPEQP